MRSANQKGWSGSIHGSNCLTSMSPSDRLPQSLLSREMEGQPTRSLLSTGSSLLSKTDKPEVEPPCQFERSPSLLGNTNKTWTSLVSSCPRLEILARKSKDGWDLEVSQTLGGHGSGREQRRLKADELEPEVRGVSFCMNRAFGVQDQTDLQGRDVGGWKAPCF